VKAVRGLDAVMVLTLVAFVALLLHPVPFVPDAARDWGLGTMVYLLPAVSLLRRGDECPEERRWTLPLALGMVSFLLANVYYRAGRATGVASFPSLADLGYLAIHPLFLAAVMAALRPHLQRVRLIVALDGITGATAGAAVATWVIAPLFERVWDGSPSAAISLAYPLCDVVLVAASLGALGLVGARAGRHFALWALGMLVFGAADTVYAYRVAFGTFELGTWVEGVWALGLVMMALGATTLRSGGSEVLPGARSLAIVTAAAACSIVVLAAAPDWGSNPLPSVLALLTLVGCGVRFTLAFLQLRELAAVREQAMTDELTGVANRRALYGELDELFRADADGGPRWAIGNGFALALIDLNHFKEVNDSFGHAAGDELLRAVVARFATALEMLQTPDLLARLGGDEFAVVLHEAGSRNASLACASALQESLEEPVALSDVVLHVQASIGVATAPLHAQNRGDMLFAADAAMYAAKRAGKDRVVRFTPGLPLQAGAREARGVLTS